MENIRNNDFIDRFIKCLKENKEFRLENAVVEGDVSIFDIYNKIKDDDDLKHLIEVNESGEIILNINIDITIINVKFSKPFKFINCKVLGENVDVVGCEFEKDILISGTIFKGEANFENNKFKEDVNFSKTTFNIAIFKKSIFESIIKFEDVSFKILVYSECIFKNIFHFKNKKDNNYEYAIFYRCVFGNREVIIDNFPLSKTSFLKTDVREILILCDIQKEEILSHKLLKNGENNTGIYKEAYDILKTDLDYKSVLAEYRNLRISIENNRTYEEASELFIYEMDLIRKMTTLDDRKIIEKINEYIKQYIIWYIYAYSTYILLIGYWIYIKPENNPIIILLTILFVVGLYFRRKYIPKILTWIAFWIYKLTSNYGESIARPIIISIFVILAIPCIITHNLNPFSNSMLLEQTLRAFF